VKRRRTFESTATSTIPIGVITSLKFATAVRVMLLPAYKGADAPGRAALSPPE
jgi:hypothetical protein